MLIIIEGTDATGKSTFAAKLAEQISDAVGVLHSGPPAEDPFTEYMNILIAYATDDDRHLVCDRFHLGELVYAPLYRGSTSLAGGDCLLLERMINHLGGVLVLLTHDVNVLLERQRALGEDFLRPEHVAQVVTAFDEVYDQSQVEKKHRLIDPTDDDAAMVIADANDDPTYRWRQS